MRLLYFSLVLSYCSFFFPSMVLRVSRTFFGVARHHVIVRLLLQPSFNFEHLLFPARSDQSIPG